MKNKKVVILNLIVFFVAATAAFFVTKLIMGNSIFTNKIIVYDNLTSDQTQLLDSALTEFHPSQDLVISTNTTTQLDPSSNSLIYDILVPVADFDTAQSNITSAELDSAQLISIRDLAPTQKLLSLDGAYYLDSFTRGAQFITLDFTGAESDISAAIALIAPKIKPSPNKSNTLSLAQTGVTALSRGMNNQLAVAGDANFFATNLADFLSGKDLTHISNEVSFADECATNSGSTTLCADWQMLDAITAIGTDIVELTGNHNNDYGATANLATIEKYHQLGLQTFGGGENAETAAQPLQIDQKNTKITLLGYNYSTTTATYGGATANLPGANLYDEETAAQDIAEAKARGDFVIVDVQFFECYSYPADGGEYPFCDAPITGSYQGVPYDQTEFFRHLIDLGADMVVGTSAHQPQTYELYEGKPIYYGLGNLFFDQIYWPGTTRGLILTHYFMNGQYLQTRISPTVYGEDYQTTLMNEEDSTWLLSRLNQAKP